MSLSQGQRQVAAVMLADPDFAVRANVDALARRAKVSPPTIVRFCRALGFAGLREFKLHLAQSLAVGTSTLHRAVVPGDTHADRDAQGLAGRGERARQPRAAHRAGRYRARRHADRESAASRLLRGRQHVDVHGERRAGALLPARPRLEFLFRRSSAARLGGDDEQARRRAGDLACRADAVPAGDRRRRRRNKAR